MSSLFHSPEFVRLHDLDMVVLDGDGLLLGPARGTYGGFTRGCTLERMEALLAYAPSVCTVKLAPASHDLGLFSRSMNALHRAGFLLEHADLNYDIVPRELDYDERINRAQRKKLAKCDRAGYESMLLDRAAWKAAHWLLEKDRERKGLRLSVPFADIVRLEAALPGTYRFYGTYTGDRMIAAAICAMVEADILYIYAWGDVGKSEFAPTVQLARAIYEDACYMGCRLLDAGISTEAGRPNAGLIAFKESLGFAPSVKATMVRR